MGRTDRSIGSQILIRFLTRLTTLPAIVLVRAGSVSRQPVTARYKRIVRQVLISFLDKTF